LVRERGASVKRVARLFSCPIHRTLFQGHGQVKPEQFEIERLGRELPNLKAERTF
jgi:hypothetical protein